MNLKSYRDKPTIPRTTVEDLIRYLRDGIRPGSFLSAVLENDLYTAASRADKANKQALLTLVMFAQNRLPMDAYGSRKKVNTWIQMGGQDGAEAAAQAYIDQVILHEVSSS